MRNRRATPGLIEAFNPQESLLPRLILLIVTSLGLAANVILLIGCVSPPTSSLYLFTITRSELASALSDLTDVDKSRLDDAVLPQSWHWGMSGSCAMYENDTSIHCRQAFPPMFSVLSMVEFTLDASSINDTSNDAVLDAWETAYKQADTHGKHFTPLSQASAALAILSLIVAVGLLSSIVASVTERLQRKPSMGVLYLISQFDGAIFLAAGILAILAMNNGPRAILLAAGRDGGELDRLIGPGMYALFAGGFLKLVVVAFMPLVSFILQGRRPRPLEVEKTTTSIDAEKAAHQHVEDDVEGYEPANHGRSGIARFAFWRKEGGR